MRNVVFSPRHPSQLPLARPNRWPSVHSLQRVIGPLSPRDEGLLQHRRQILRICADRLSGLLAMLIRTSGAAWSRIPNREPSRGTANGEGGRCCSIQQVFIGLLAGRIARLLPASASRTERVSRLGKLRVLCKLGLALLGAPTVHCVARLLDRGAPGSRGSSRS